jgi:hypothetical protein
MNKYLLILITIIASSFSSNCQAFEWDSEIIQDGRCHGYDKIKIKYIMHSMEYEDKVLVSIVANFKSPASTQDSIVSIEFLDSDGFKVDKVDISSITAGKETSFDVREYVYIYKNLFKMATSTRIVYRINS